VPELAGVDVDTPEELFEQLVRRLNHEAAIKVEGGPV
jgi:hypothetical protein